MSKSAILGCMDKPIHHLEKPIKTGTLQLEKGSPEFETIEKLLGDRVFSPLQIERISIPYLWKAYQKEKQRLVERRSNSVEERLLFHVTRESASKKIKNEGFCVNLVRNLAFGKGVNLYSSVKSVYEHLERYTVGERFVIFVCQTIIGAAHENSSDLKQIVFRNGAGFSKPRYLRPKPGYDAMYSNDAEHSIWVIPSKKRVYPSYLVILNQLES